MPWEGLAWFSLVLASYLIGGIPTAYLATRLLKGQDIRQLGDYNAGAANVFRNVSPRAGLAVGAIDIAKGFVVVLLVRALSDSTPVAMLAGAAVVAGHNWPVYLKLRGGRGAATAVGVLMAMLPVLAIPLGILSLVVLYLTRRAIISLGFFLIATPVLAWPAGYSYPLVAYAFGIPVMVGISHYLSVRRQPATPQSSNEPALPL